MPYDANSELPKAVRDALPDDAQSVYRAAYNRTAAKNQPEAECHMAAWGAVKNAGFRRNGDGSWVKKQQPAADQVHVDAPLGDRKRKPMTKEPDDTTDETEDDDDEELPIVAKSEDIDPESVAFAVTIAKVDEDQRLVFGWLSVAEVDGQLVVDRQGHVIEPAELEKAAYDFVIESRVAGEMHEQIGVGKMIESMMFTADKQKALGIDLGKVGWWVGFKVDPEVFAKVKSGELRALSIGGLGIVSDYQPAEAA